MLNAALRVAGLLLLSLAPLAACSSDTDSSAAGQTSDADADARTVDTEDGDASALPPRPEGTQLVFDLEADPAIPGQFYEQPWPLDTRLSADGTIVLSGIENPTNVDLVDGLRGAAEELYGYPQLPVAYFQATAPLAPRDDGDVIRPSADAPILWLDIDEDSPERGRAIPTIARTMERDGYTSENVIAVAPRPGFVLRPNTTYAVVVQRSLGDAEGAELGVSETIWSLAHGVAPPGDVDATLAASFEPLWQTLDELDVPRSAVASAAVFTTGDVVAELFDLTERVRDAYSPQVRGLDLGGGATRHDRYCEYHGEIAMPQFQQGDPPFDTEGLFEIGADGLPIEQRTTTIPVVITLPRREMPEEGFPLVMYFHGSGGISTQLVDRGPVLGPGQRAQYGLGPAHVLAGQGFAAVGSAHPVNPERVPGATSIEYLNFNNLKSFRDIFRQGVIEQRLLLDALLALQIPQTLLDECEGLSLPSSADGAQFDPQPIYAMGQSMGGMYTNLVGPVEPRIEAVVPTGAGGYWSYFVPRITLIGGVPDLVSLLLRTDAQITHLHPVLHILQSAWEPAEPFVYVSRLGFSPLPTHPARSIYEPVAPGDSFFSTEIYDAIAIAYEHPQAGEEVWPSMQQALSLDDRDGLVDYPVVNNMRSIADGAAYTSAVVQYEPDGFSDPHVIFVQLDEVKHQYGCFFRSHYEIGDAILSPPNPEGSPCVLEP